MARILRHYRSSLLLPRTLLTPLTLTPLAITAALLQAARSAAHASYTIPEKVRLQPREKRSRLALGCPPAVVDFMAVKGKGAAKRGEKDTKGRNYRSEKAPR